MSQPDEHHTLQQAGDWPQTKLAGMTDYHALTAAAKALDAIAAVKHPGENHFYYPTFINLIYKELFNVPKGKTRGLRKRLTTPQLQKLHTVERRAAQWIRDALAASDDYHQVYYQVQHKVQALVKQLGAEDLAPTVPTRKIRARKTSAPTPTPPTANSPTPPANLQLF